MHFRNKQAETNLGSLHAQMEDAGWPQRGNLDRGEKVVVRKMVGVLKTWYRPASQAVDRRARVAAQPRRSRAQGRVPASGSCVP